MTFDGLPEPLKRLLNQEYERERREDFLCIENELLMCFLEQEHISKQWNDFKEDWFINEMRSPDTEMHWYDWLRAKGIDP